MTRPATVMSQAGTAVLADHTTDGDAWLPFNVALLDQALKDGRPVLVDWTADWCINCRVLEATVLAREGSRQSGGSSECRASSCRSLPGQPPCRGLNHKLGSRSHSRAGDLCPRAAEPASCVARQLLARARHSGNTGRKVTQEYYPPQIRVSGPQRVLAVRMRFPFRLNRYRYILR